MPAARRSTRTASSTVARDSAQPYTTTRTNARRSPSARPSASVERSTTTGNKPGLRLTVKAPPSKLRQATSNGAPDVVHGRSIPPNPYTGSGIESESDVTPAPPAGRTARSTRNPRAVVEPESEEEEEEEDAEGEDEEMDGEAEVDQELLANDDDEDEEEDAEGEEEDMADHPPPPIIKRQPAGKTGRALVTVTAPPEGPLKSVETKQMGDDDDDDDDEELSELEEDDDDENELDSTLANDPEDLSSDADAQGSRSATPDLSKLTARQRGLYVQDDAAAAAAGSTVENAGLMALSNEALKKKHFTDEEHAMRRQEMARRRKNLSDRRNEEEKMETINKLLLKKSNPKRRSRAEIIAAQYAEAVAGQTSRGTPGLSSSLVEDGSRGGGEVEGTMERAEPGFTRYVLDSRGPRLGVPGEWAGAPVGEVFWGTGGMGGRGRRVVEELG
ncbi:hypothetical protein LTR29_007372 [Friedmanniomyces endolithicus]|nr:hypothetical protein LTR29_007372 [Friedmanniomyces endolithicus]